MSPPPPPLEVVQDPFGRGKRRKKMQLQSNYMINSMCSGNKCGGGGGKFAVCLITRPVARAPSPSSVSTANLHHSSRPEAPGPGSASHQFSLHITSTATPALKKITKITGGIASLFFFFGGRATVSESDVFSFFAWLSFFYICLLPILKSGPVLVYF